MAKYDNHGKVDVERAADDIVKGGGGRSSSWKGDHMHHTAYSRDEDRHLSWDEYPDGSIRNVHTDKNGKSYTQYGNK